jgi:hypothetical protein
MAYIAGKNTKGRGIDATNRGATRWERAARNALRNPHSAAAKVYNDRVNLALTVSTAQRTMGDSKDGPWQFIGVRYDQTRGAKRARIYSTCSTYCTVLQITLDFGKRNLEGVAQVFALKADPSRPWQHTVERLDTKTLKRPITCYVCTRKIGAAKR